MPPSIPALIDDAEPGYDVVADPPAEADRSRRHLRPAPEPGDGLIAVSSAAMAGINAVGLGIAVASRVLRFRRLPSTLQGAVITLDHQPQLRRLLEERIGERATATALGMATTAVNALGAAPSMLAVDLAINTIRAIEARADARSWARREPELARPGARSAQRTADSPESPVDQHLQRGTWIQAIGAAVVAATSRDPELAGNAALVAVPKATRATHESFAATLGRGLANNDEALQVDPGSLRRLDRIDVVILDPRVLRTDSLRLARLRGTDEKDLTAWESARAMLAEGDLRPGWHRVTGRPGTEALFAPAPHPLAAATLAETQRAQVRTVTVDDSTGLGVLRPAFDEIASMTGDSIDDALLDAVRDYQQEGHTVAVISSTAAQALSAADLGVGILPDDSEQQPLDADLIVDDLSGVWRVLHALPAAQAATRLGIALSTGASALGSMLLIPTVRGRGPEPVALGAAVGLVSGYWSARQVIAAPLPRPVPVDEWHAMSVEQVRSALASPSQPDFAPDARTAQRHVIWQFLDAVRDELSDPLTPVLGLGATATALLGAPIDALMVGSVLASNAVLAAGQRLSAELRLDRLLAEQIPPAWKVTIRPDGTRERVQVLPDQLQRGDLIEVGPDDVVPADARVIEQEKLEVDEASLTGESLPVAKQVDATPGAELAERRCMLFAGTTVASGTGLALVTAVGPDTEVRRAADLVTSRHGDIGLTHQLGQITTRTWPLSLMAGGLVSVLGVLRATRLQQAVANGVSVAVAAVPEGMPVVATLAQHASAQRLTKSGVLVRVPRSVEALGRVDVVCFDKTGTLSENRLRVTEVRTASGHSRDEVLRCARRATASATGQSHVDATDAAIVAAAEAVPHAVVSAAADAHLPFRSGRPFAASVFGTELTIKGAPEVVLSACADVPADIDDVVEQLADEGLRVLAVARRELSPAELHSLSADPDDPEAQLAAMAQQCADGLTLVGFVGISDTPRAGSAGLLAELDRRQVPVRMITGDHPTTGRAIARNMGLNITAEQVITGSEWETLSGKEQERAVAERVVFARMSPANKVQVVQALERSGRVSAMVGDGANDAAAIRAATVGIGIVAQGSDAAHTAADVVLLDGRIETLLDALNEGSQLWQRVQAAVAVLLGGNASGALFAIIGSALTGQAPLSTRQLLLVNIVTDAFPATALAISQPRRPMPFGGRGPDEQALLRAVALRGTTTAAATLAAWLMARATGFPRRASTVALVALVTTQLGQTLLESRSPVLVATAGGSFAAMTLLISIPGVSQFMGCTPLGPIGWAQALGSAAVAITAAGIAPRFLSRPEAD
ncbi:cation-translocating P-type ATPase [Mycolicibacter sp. MYC123]|uniref:Cation-translocating P-type ATPase n=1 Tax=[Mycobacterium] zoologicum TaxID=2872311 RepID=A0ABU5YN90_9MYCO|nr:MULTISPECIES: cation-translocating P-type ATPase [unclassified Mycolicibacter]MEB3051527.1 cation-translocating P-type ATPase [Mycolicibacter sp. MYC123]MEB3061349.1 cation-translocating P-type ATPase [Mycolicibacter sp. MYC101]